MGNLFIDRHQHRILESWPIRRAWSLPDLSLQDGRRCQSFMSAYQHANAIVVLRNWQQHMVARGKVLLHAEVLPVRSYEQIWTITLQTYIYRSMNNMYERKNVSFKRIAD